MEGFPQAPEEFKPKSDVPNADDWGGGSRGSAQNLQHPPWPDDGGTEPEFPPTPSQILDDDFLNMYGLDDT